MPIPDPSRLATRLRDLRDRHGEDVAPYVDDALAAIETPRRPGLDGPDDAPSLSVAEIAGLLDHTELHPEATVDDVQQVCDEARTHGFASVCVHPVFIRCVATELEGTPVLPCTVIGFPHGANRPDTKAYEASKAVGDGAREVDLVQAIGALRSGRFRHVERDVRAVVDAARAEADANETTVLVKVILETALLSDAEKAVACVIANRAGADYVKTSTGFASGGATVEDVALMRQVVGDAMGVKASGGVRTADDLRTMVAHGATRIGASGSVDIVTGA